MKRSLSLFIAAFVAASFGLGSGAMASAQPRGSDRPIPIDQALLHINFNFRLTPLSKYIATLVRDIECEAGLIQCKVPMAKPVTPTTVPPVIVVIPPVKVSVPPVAVSVPPVVISVTPVVVPPVVAPVAPVVLPVVPPVTIPTGSTSTCSVTVTGNGVAQCDQSSSVSAQS
jgi:hypothetical protein